MVRLKKIDEFFDNLSEQEFENIVLECGGKRIEE